MNKIIIVVCEGNSEYAYLQELNRFLRENEMPLYFKGEVSDGGDFSKVNSCFRGNQKNNVKMHIVVWVDNDIYKRNDRGYRDAYAKKPQGIPDFKFNCENFEDFLVMHLPDDKVSDWQTICSNKGHFTNPLHSAQYLPLLSSAIFPNYKKGTLPESLTINTESLHNLKCHNHDKTIPFRSDFAEFMIEEIERAKESVLKNERMITSFSTTPKNSVIPPCFPSQ